GTAAPESTTSQGRGAADAEADHRDSGRAAVVGGVGRRTVFRPEQSPVRPFPVRHFGDGALRRVLLRRGAQRGGTRGAAGGALVRAALAGARPHVHTAATHHPL